ncbi:MAG: DUF58 domain-containing protein [Planctomycetes bacterium]|nr:DUF58 domain-containing protein [Planctomycetota bacterium]
MIRLLRSLPRPTPFGILWSTTLLIPASLFVRFQLQVPGLVFSILLSFLLAGWAGNLLNLAGARLERTAPRRVGAGRAFSVRWRLSNTSRAFPAEGVEISVHPGRVLRVTCVPSGGHAEWNTPLRLTRRGVRDLPPASISSAAPLGLFRRSLERPAPCRVVVTPRYGRFRTPVLDGILREAESLRSEAGIADADGTMLRHYHPGDPARWIHWRSTAHRGTLTVLPPERTVLEPLTVELDLGAGDLPAGRSRSLFERAVSVAATLLRDADTRGLPLRLAWHGDPAQGDGPGAAPLGDLLEALATVRLAPGSASASGPVPPGALRVTCRADGPASRVLRVGDAGFFRAFRYEPRADG